MRSSTFASSIGPKLVFFFDEAHLLFTGASKAFLTSVTQTVRLIRSKGVGIFFVTQNPGDLPGEVLGQLGNRVQHALRTFTPEDAKALAKTVSTFPRTQDYDLEESLTSLGIGEAMVTVLSERGAPTPVAWTMLRSPRSLMAQLDPAEQQRQVAASPLQARYGTQVDRESAYERLAARLAPPPSPAAQPAPAEQPPPEQRVDHQDDHQDDHPDGGGAGEAVAKVLGSPAFRAFARSAASALGREVTRGILGNRSRRR